MDEGLQGGLSLCWAEARLGAVPLAQAGLDEAFGFAACLRGV